LHILIQSDALHLPLADETVQCVVTSPPYWGLRDYGLPPLVWGGLRDCRHKWKPHRFVKSGGHNGFQDNNKGSFFERTSYICERCGAWRGCLGLEPTPEMYVEHLVEIFRQIG